MLIATPLLFLTPRLCPLCLFCFFLSSCPAHTFPCLSLSSVTHFIALFLCQSDCQFLPICFFFLCFFFLSFTRAPTASPHLPFIPLTHSSFPTVVTLVFSSIYSKSTRLLKEVQLPWASLFTRNYISPSQFVDVISFTPTPPVSRP